MKLGCALALGSALTAAGCTKWMPVGASSDAGADAASVAAAVDAGPPLTPLWSDRELRLAELPSAQARFSVDDTSYEMRFKGFPAGTKVAAGGRVTSIAGDYTERVDVGMAISAMSPTSALDDKAPLDPRTDFEVRVPGYAPMKAAAPPCRVSTSLGMMMAKAVDHSVLFPREAATDPPLADHSILFVPTSGRATVFGPAATMREVDWVAVAEALPPRKAGTCPIPPESGSGPPTYAKFHLVDEEVTVVERKTARVIERKTFPASTQCPTFAYEGVAESSPDEAAMKRWLRDERSK
jgi:hypothetical protein